MPGETSPSPGGNEYPGDWNVIGSNVCRLFKRLTSLGAIVGRRITEASPDYIIDPTYRAHRSFEPSEADAYFTEDMEQLNKIGNADEFDFVCMMKKQTRPPQ